MTCYPFDAYTTSTFSEIYPDYQSFYADYATLDIDLKLTNPEDTLILTFYLLTAKYGNSSILADTIPQFKKQLFSTIYQYTPTWERKTAIQEQLRTLSEEDIIRSSLQVVNHAYNPSTLPATDYLERLTYVNEQTSSGYKKNKIDAYTSLYAVLEDDITTDYLNKFKSLFISIVMPNIPSWYKEQLTD